MTGLFCRTQSLNHNANVFGQREGEATSQGALFGPLVIPVAEDLQESSSSLWVNYIQTTGNPRSVSEGMPQSLT